MNLIQVSDSGFLDPIVDEIIANNPDEVQRYKDGKKQLMGFFVGQAMKASKGKANPKLVTEMVTKKLQSEKFINRTELASFLGYSSSHSFSRNAEQILQSKGYIPKHDKGYLLADAKVLRKAMIRGDRRVQVRKVKSIKKSEAFQSS